MTWCSSPARTPRTACTASKPGEQQDQVCAPVRARRRRRPVRICSEGNLMKTIDIHAHIISEETARLMQKEAPKVGPRITLVDADTAVYEVAGVSYRPFPRGGFDLERRLKDMAASDVDMQAVSITPQTFLYNQDASLNATLAR